MPTKRGDSLQVAAICCNWEQRWIAPLPMNPPSPSRKVPPLPDPLHVERGKRSTSVWRRGRWNETHGFMGSMREFLFGEFSLRLPPRRAGREGRKGLLGVCCNSLQLAATAAICCNWLQVGAIWCDRVRLVRRKSGLTRRSAPPGDGWVQFTATGLTGYDWV
jgi:hypothetical protein